ncbi:alpha-hydroxy acid oxidase [Streptomyces sp. NPDC002559]
MSTTDRPSAAPSDGWLELADAERAARAALPADVWDFLAGGSGAETTLAANRAALDAVTLVPRVLAGAPSAHTGTDLFGARLTMPVAIAPMAYQRLFHPEGELAAARAAEAAGVPFVAGMLNSHPVERIAGACAATWFQLYWLRDRAAVADLVIRAEEAGCRALLLTVDVPRMGRRLRDMRNGFALPPTVTADNLAAGAPASAHAGAPGRSAVMVHTAEAFDPALGWADLAWLRERTRLPLVLKGVLHPDDAARAAGLGIDGLVVSNHGGRQLDGAVPSAAVLPAIRDAVAGRSRVLVDSGIRSGLDVLRALALGADGVLLGRPALWGLAADGRHGVARVLSLLRAELEEAMLLAGCPDLPAAACLDRRVGAFRSATADDGTGRP